jgi:SAM-dependent methyltransferase
VHRGVALTYGADAAHLGPALAERFVALDADDATRAFVDSCFEAPTGAGRAALRAVAASMMSIYDANALARTHPMFVLSRAQWARLLPPDAPRGTLLDIGAGDGGVTAELAPLFGAVTTTETSAPMARRLRERGYACREIDLTTDAWPDTGGRFDAVSLLNVIDRTRRPLTLLDRARALLAPGGLLLVAVPLPVSAAVQVAGGTVDPDELLPVPRTSWEDDARALAMEALPALGYDVVRLARAPYLCRGKKARPVLTLDDAIVLARPRA